MSDKIDPSRDPRGFAVWAHGTQFEALWDCLDSILLEQP